jgi:dihydroneopterin aldolase
MNQTTIELKSLEFYARHGLLPEEAALGQRFCIDLNLRLNDGLQFQSDDIAATINYALVYERVKDIFLGHRFNLLEAAAEAIVLDLLKNFPLLAEVSIKIRKPSVPVDCICEHFAVEITRCR